MPQIFDELCAHPPKIFVIQTRGPLILRDLDKLIELSRYTTLRVSFSITTNREEIRRLYEPHCATIHERIETVRRLRDAGIETFATLGAAPALRSGRIGGAGVGRHLFGHYRRSLAYPRFEAARRNHPRSRFRDQPAA